MGVISFYDVAKAVVDSQDFENRMLKAYIRDWPVGPRRRAPTTLWPALDSPATLGRRRLRPDAGAPCPAAPSATLFRVTTFGEATARRSAA